MVGVYAGFADKIPMGLFFNKGLTMRGGQMQGQRHVPLLFDLIREGRIDPGFMLTHPMSLSDGSRAYELFNSREDGCIRAVLTP